MTKNDDERGGAWQKIGELSEAVLSSQDGTGTGCRVIFDSHSKDFDKMTHDATFEVLAEGEIGAHEAAIYIEDEEEGNSLVFTSKPYEKGEGEYYADIKTLKVDGPNKGRIDVVFTNSNLVNGGTKGTDGRLYFCFQGCSKHSSAFDDDSSDFFRSAGIYSVDPKNWKDWRSPVDGVPKFNSPNDVATRTTDSSMWFTDPSYAFAQGLTPPPEVGDWVWRLDRNTGKVNVVADGFHRPNGVCFSVDQSTLFVTDTGMATGKDPDPKLPRSIYAFDVYNERMLTNRRLVYVADCGIPDGLVADGSGILYTGCGDGVHVVDPSTGDLLGKIKTESKNCDPAANLCFRTISVHDDTTEADQSAETARSTLYILVETAIVAVHINTKTPTSP